MPRGGAEHTLARREEIITACEQLYLERDFHDVTIKDIGTRTTFTRTSIYNYFETKEEIFLALLRREYLAWAADLAALGENASGGADALAEGLACTLDRRTTMLRLMSTSLFEMEAHSRVEALADFKRACKTLMAALDGCTAAFCPEMDERARGRFSFAFLPFVYGVYPYSTVTEKQRMAMDRAEMRYDPPAQHEMVRQGAAMLLGGR